MNASSLLEPIAVEIISAATAVVIERRQNRSKSTCVSSW